MHPRSLGLFSLLPALLVACAATPPAPAAAPAPSAAPEAEHHHELDLPPVGSSVSVTLDGHAQSVELASVPHAPEAHTVPLLAVLKAAWPAEDPSRLHFELVGSDGFRPTARSKCGRRITGDEASHAALDVVTHNVSFDDTLSLPGCFRVKAVVAIDVAR